MVAAALVVQALFFFFLILRRMGKNKALGPTLPRIRYMSCFDSTHVPVATTARATYSTEKPAFW